MSKIVVLFTAICIVAASFLAYAGGNSRVHQPPLDVSLMAFKEQGAWYFLCTAPAFPYRIPPHYATYGPPPPPCGPVPCAPAPTVPMKVK
ncbi:hypothetical protein [Desulfomonile tiedjei]|uniref:Uncharacterized protein n=1 Tax=Desulfomonile tiedjei (strain ATCC 49306 / DSM 6799 / DCB-1) TaxID=706587 RepID=I4CC07_DESTA|nr:hypothetical protein [Desulfomonile tiedjei]AFM27098.1 hypothetical protein Desti_4466 [Desulfomonile tiedjei DSM 6799]